MSDFDLTHTNPSSYVLQSCFVSTSRLGLSGPISWSKFARAVLEADSPLGFPFSASDASALDELSFEWPFQALPLPTYRGQNVRFSSVAALGHHLARFFLEHLALQLFVPVTPDPSSGAVTTPSTPLTSPLVQNSLLSLSSQGLAPEHPTFLDEFKKGPVTRFLSPVLHQALDFSPHSASAPWEFDLKTASAIVDECFPTLLGSCESYGRVVGPQLAHSTVASLFARERVCGCSGPSRGPLVPGLQALAGEPEECKSCSSSMYMKECRICKKVQQPCEVCFEKQHTTEAFSEIVEANPALSVGDSSFDSTSKSAWGKVRMEMVRIRPFRKLAQLILERGRNLFPIQDTRSTRRGAVASPHILTYSRASALAQAIFFTIRKEEDVFYQKVPFECREFVSDYVKVSTILSTHLSRLITRVA